MSNIIEKCNDSAFTMGGAMKTITGSILLVCVLLLGGPAAAQVSGFCFLADSGDHSGTTVHFISASPSAVTDSCQTNATGAYTITLASGLYEVGYRHEGYLPVDLPDPIFAGASPVVLDDVTLQPGTVIEVSGRPGTSHWTSGTIVRVVGNVIIESFETLTIDPGVRVLFAGYFALSIFGRAEFQGAEGDSIVFESELSGAGPNSYNYISFSGCATGFARYCVFRHAGEVKLGGACQNPPAEAFEVSHCLLERVSYGFFVGEGRVHLSDCLVRNNTWYGIWAAYADSNCVIERCTVQDIPFHAGIKVENSFRTKVIDCVVEDLDPLVPFNYGIDATNSSPVIRGCTVRDAQVAGIELGGSVTDALLVERCVLTGNAAGIRTGNCLGTIRNNTMVDNPGHGLLMQNSLAGGGPTIIQNILTGNGTGITIDGEVDLVAYNDIWGNSVDFDGTDLPLMFGDLVTVNGNGDPSDIYLNIFLDPAYTDPGADDWTLTAGSPCIDAGDPGLTDPDGTVADLGAFFFDQVSPAPLPPAARPRFHQIAPNPFNPMTRIAYDLPAAGPVRLEVFDPRGRQVRVLVDGKVQGPGIASAGWDGLDQTGRPLPAGVYLFRLTTTAGAATGRATLIK